MWKGAFFVRTFLISVLSWNGSFNSFIRFCHDATTVVLFVEITERTDEENKEAAHSITERRRPYVILRTGRKFLSSGLLLPTSPYGATGQRGKTQSTLWHSLRTESALLVWGDHVQFPCQSSNMTKKHQLNGFSEVADDEGHCTITIVHWGQ